MVGEMQCLKEMLPEREGVEVPHLLPYLLPTRLLGPSKGPIYLETWWQGSDNSAEQDWRQTGNLWALLPFLPSLPPHRSFQNADLTSCPRSPKCNQNSSLPSPGLRPVSEGIKLKIGVYLRGWSEKNSLRTPPSAPPD